MVDGLTRDVTAEEIGAFRETGVVSLKGILRRGVDLLVDPYTAGNAGAIQVHALKDLDVALRHAESFASTEDLIA